MAFVDEKNQIIKKLTELAKLVRYYILISTSSAGSGHPTTSLSSTDLMTVLFFSQFRFDFNNPENPFNDRLIFSKGHASPLLYSLYAATGVIKENELLRLRKIDSPLEGHPTLEFKYTEAATGSLGQGLSVGVGMAIALRAQYQISRPKADQPLAEKIKYQKLPNVYVLLGDGEMAEGSVWEAIEIASYYKLDNLIGILDVNRLGQSQETMLGWNVEAYEKRLAAFGWNTIVVDGHDIEEILEAFKKVTSYKLQVTSKKPWMIIAKTIKGKGVSFIENKEGWHGKALDEEKLKLALKELGEVDKNIHGQVNKPAKIKYQISNISAKGGSASGGKNSKLNIPYKIGDEVATREAYGDALVQLGEQVPQIVVLDGDTKNSTYSEKFKAKFPDRFFEMFIAEQNMVGTALGMSKRGFILFVSTFAAFFTRTFDQIRMSALSKANIKLCGSHAGVSIGEDGASQMGLEDLAMMRSVYGSTVLYPADGVSATKLMEQMVSRPGIVYLRTTRGKTPVIYGVAEDFKIGGSKVHNIKDQKSPPKADPPRAENIKNTNQKSKIITIVAAGITLHEALAAQQELAKEKIFINVIDCYSIKPIDSATLIKAAKESKAIITVEDHWKEGGLGDAVLEALSCERTPVYKLAVSKMPHSGKPQELLEIQGIDRKAIVRKVKELIK